jgi:hypothetical protein
MHDLYATWIAVHVCGSVRGRCAAWTTRMQRAFPELTRVAGLVTRTDLTPAQVLPWLRGHWWLTTPDGRIVDPTQRQFPWPLIYLPCDEEDAA